MGMRVLVDTNVLLDYLLKREPYGELARVIIKACQEKKIVGCIAAHSITNMFYILRKDFSIKERRAILLDICQLFDVVGIERNKLQEALKNEAFSDFEDSLQMECAKEFYADYIITRNMTDFEQNVVPCIDPERFCEML